MPSITQQANVVTEALNQNFWSRLEPTGGQRARTDQGGHFLRMKYIRMKLAKKVTVGKAENDRKVRASREAEMPLKPKEPGESTISPSSENRISVGIRCVWNLVYQNNGNKTHKERHMQCLKELSSILLGIQSPECAGRSSYR